MAVFDAVPASDLEMVKVADADSRSEVDGVRLRDGEPRVMDIVGEGLEDGVRLRLA
jgi:hypothetical protein